MFDYGSYFSRKEIFNHDRTLSLFYWRILRAIAVVINRSCMKPANQSTVSGDRVVKFASRLGG